MEEVDRRLWADGGTFGGSPGTGVYWSIGNKKSGIIRYRDLSGQKKHSDEAEYLALEAALQLLLRVSQAGEVAVVQLDCQPVVWHIQNYKTPRNARLREHYWAIREMLKRLKKNGVEVRLKWVPRTEMMDVLGH